MPNTLVEIWQTNASGAYLDPADPGFMSLDPNFTGAGRTITDSDGRYDFRTIKPAAYPGEIGGLFRPAHIHTSLFGPLLASRLVTQCYFEGDPLLDRDPILGSIPDPRGHRAAAGALQLGRHRGRRHRLGARLRLGHRPARPGGDADGGLMIDAELQSPSQTSGPLFGFALMFDGCDEAVPPDSPGAVRHRGRSSSTATASRSPGRSASSSSGTGEQWARTRTDERGRLPRRRPQAGSRRRCPTAASQAPHLNVAVFARGLLKQALTRVYFPDEDGANARRPGPRAGARARTAQLLVAARDGDVLRFDIHLQGENETPFFAF